MARRRVRIDRVLRGSNDQVLLARDLRRPGSAELRKAMRKEGVSPNQKIRELSVSPVSRVALVFCLAMTSGKRETRKTTPVA